MHMKLSRKITRWLSLCCGILIGLFYLNSAAYASWISWGPPNDFPLRWEHESIVRFGLSLSALSVGMILFSALKKGFSFKSKNYSFYCFVCVLVLSLMYPKAREYILIDSCLDSGGYWQSDYFQCAR